MAMIVHYQPEMATRQQGEDKVSYCTWEALFLDDRHQCNTRCSHFSVITSSSTTDPRHGERLIRVASTSLRSLRTLREEKRVPIVDIRRRLA